MQNQLINAEEPIHKLNKTFLLDFPESAARKLEKIDAEDAAEIFASQQPNIISGVMNKMSPGTVASILKKIPRDLAAQAISTMDTGISITQLNGMTKEER